MVSDILDLFNDSIKDEQSVLGIGFCNGMCKCALHDQWMEPKMLLQKMFRESSLEDIAGRGTFKAYMQGWMAAQPLAIPDRRKMPQFNLSNEEVDHLSDFLIWTSKVNANDWPPTIEG